MNSLISSSLSVETATQYTRIWEGFKTFCEQSLTKTFVVSRENIALYIAHSDLRGLQPSTIQSHLSAISFISQLNDLPDYTASFTIDKIMKSLHKKSTSSDIRLPIGQNLLQNLIKILPALCTSAYECALYGALFSLAYYALLRASECTSSKHVLCIDNITRTALSGVCHSIEINFSSYKHSSKKSMPVLQIQRRVGDTCPVQIIDQYLSQRPSCKGPIFITSLKKSITPKQFRDKLKSCIKFISLDPTRYNTHSFRIGICSMRAIQKAK